MLREDNVMWPAGFASAAPKTRENPASDRAVHAFPPVRFADTLNRTGDAGVAGYPKSVAVVLDGVHQRFRHHHFVTPRPQLKAGDLL